MMYSIPIAVLVMLGIKFLPPKILTSVVFVFTFIYLMIVRYLHYFFEVSELASQANGLQLLMTLRVIFYYITIAYISLKLLFLNTFLIFKIIGLSFEISDARRARTNPEDLADVKPRRYLEKDPSLFEIFNYFYHFCGLFTGPYYTYQMLLDSRNSVLLTSWSPLPEIRERVLRLCWSVPLFIIFNKFFPLDNLRSDAVWEMSFIFRIIYAAAVFLVFRTRVYSAWAISESICVTLGIGIYPVESKPRTVVGPTDLKKYRVELTMFVSALWHGTYAGYFMRVFHYTLVTYQ
uniref:Lysophospholipid acyltransferase 7 n=1 Tax=Heterorhabditis bacteriophora TaxID=37862 RepID=A0A1I7XM51_HETBA